MQTAGPRAANCVGPVGCATVAQRLVFVSCPVSACCPPRSWGVIHWLDPNTQSARAIPRHNSLSCKESPTAHQSESKMWMNGGTPSNQGKRSKNGKPSNRGPDGFSACLDPGARPPEPAILIVPTAGAAGAPLLALVIYQGVPSSLYLGRADRRNARKLTQRTQESRHHLPNRRNGSPFLGRVHTRQENCPARQHSGIPAILSPNTMRETSAYSTKRWYSGNNLARMARKGSVARG